MAGSAAQSQPQLQPPVAEEEALKRNTDCVYFLASPLTCKKGTECEYRHSDSARLNPRDCWYWMNSNCLNPKCPFRHPPLDGFLGTQKPTSAGPSAPALQTVAVPAPRAQSACLYFQQGYCYRGDWCQYAHVPNSLNTKALSVPGTASAVDPANIKKPTIGIEKAVVQKVAPTNTANSVKNTSLAKPPVELESAPARNESAIKRRAPQAADITTEFPGHRSAPPISNGNQVSWLNRVQQSQLFEEPEIKDAEVVSREPSPGFDVLVDDEGRDSDFYAGEDRYGMSREHGAEYDIDYPIDYNKTVDDERYHSPLGFDSLEQQNGQYPSEQHRAGFYRERRPYSRNENLGQVDESDLRHLLAKHKNPNGLRSVISHEHVRDMQVGDRRYQGLRRDEQQISLRENSLGSRLKGRIQLPGRSSSPNNRDMIGSADRARRLSPVRSSHQGRVRDRIKGWVEEPYNNGRRIYRDLQSRRDIVGENGTDFAGPKSLAELKNRKNAEPCRGQNVTDHQSLGKRRHAVLDNDQQGGNGLSFEGPKPLEEILKRKRRETTGLLIGRNSTTNEDTVEGKNQEEGKGATNNKTVEVHESELVQNIEAGESKRATSNPILIPIASKLEAEDGEQGAVPESEPYEQRDGESDYYQMGGGDDYEIYDGETGDAEGEYVEEEEDDNDDFAKKMGVTRS